MTVSLSYDAQLSRVRITANGLNDALTALVERSTNQITWTTVRGGIDVPVTAGTMATVDDYEFTSSVPNYYRVTYTSQMSFVAAGTVAHANNASVTPGLPTGHAAGDLLLALVAIRNSGSGVPATLAGWTPIIDGSNMKLFGKIRGSSESAPTFTFTGGVANADTSAQVAAFRGVSLTPVGTPVAQLNGSAQDIAVPGINLPVNMQGGLNIWVGWKQDDWTSVGVVSGGTEIGEPATTTGDDQGIVWDYRILPNSTTFNNLSSRTFAVTGGVAAISRAGTAVFEHSLTSQSNSITPTLTDVWLKSLARPFLNTPVDVFGTIDTTRRARNGVFPVVGRSLPLAVTDVRGSREYTLRVKTLDDDTAERLDLVFASGDPLYVHAPPGIPVKSMYVVVGDTEDEQPVPGTHFWTLPITEVAAPGPDIVGATATYQTVLNAYSTYSALLAGEPTYQDVVERIGDPSDVIVS